MIKEPSDIFQLNYKKIKSLEGWGELSVENLKQAINKSNNISLDRFIYSIGIRHIGQENAKILASFFVSIEQFSNLFKSKNRETILKNLADLDGIGQTQVESIETFFSDSKNVKIVSNLINQLSVSKISLKKKSGIFSGKRLMFTGGFKKISRSEAKTIAEDKGGKVLGSISKKLDFLIVGNSKPTKKKIDQAKNLGIKVITEIEWEKILNSWTSIFKI